LGSRRTRYDRNALAGEIGDARQAGADLDQQAAAIDERHQAEIQSFLSRQRHRSRAALEIDPPILDSLQAVLERDLDPFLLSSGSFSCLRRSSTTRLHKSIE